MAKGGLYPPGLDRILLCVQTGVFLPVPCQVMELERRLPVGNRPRSPARRLGG